MPEGIIWVTSKASLLLNSATLTAIIVLIVKITIMYFIKLSSNLYFPTIKKIKLIKRSIVDHKTRSFVKPKSCEAKPAVTIVTAACMVNIVAKFNR